MAAPPGSGFVIEPVKTESTPLSARITRRLRAAIEGGELAAGTRLPSEPVLARQLGVSRASLREALRVLEQERLLSRRPGVGTYVTARAGLGLQRGLDELFSTTELIESHGFQAGTAGTVVRALPASGQLAADLRIAPGAPLLHLSRTRLASGAPVIESEEYLPLALLDAAGVDSSDLPTVDSMYSFLAERLRRPIALAQATVVPTIATVRLAARLKVPRGHPLLLLEQVHLDADHQPVLVSRNYHNPDMIRFRVLRRRAP